MKISSHLLRFRLRTLMVAVAIIGLCFAGAVARGRLERDVRRYRHRVAYLNLFLVTDRLHAEGRALNGGNLCGEWSFSIPAFDPTVSPQLRAARLAYHGALKRKYEYATRYPWLPVPPDPPEPK